MATLHIRNLDDALRDRLRIQAARHGRSMEAEARALLAAAVAPAPEKKFDPRPLQEWIAAHYDGKPPQASRALIRERRQAARREVKEAEARRRA